MCKDLSEQYEREANKVLEVLRKVEEFREVKPAEVEVELKKVSDKIFKK